MAGDQEAGSPEPTLCGILVTYHPEAPRLATVLERATTQLDSLLVLDNSIDPLAQSLVDRALTAGGTTRGGTPPRLLPRSGNVGLSRALNAGLRAGLIQGCTQFLLLDQDSELEPGCADALRRAIAGFATGDHRPIELAACNLEGDPTGLQLRLDEVLYRYGIAGGDPRPAPLAMTSGLVVTAESLRATGLFDESIFLDSVDHEFCLRSRSSGVRLFVVPSARILHALGRRQSLRRGPLSVDVRQANVDRLYYSTRDTLRAARRHARHSPFVCVTLFGFIVSRTFVYGFVGRRGSGWFRAICRGWTDFLRTPDRPQIPRVA